MRERIGCRGRGGEMGAADWPPPPPLRERTRRRGRRIACCASYSRAYFGPFQQSLVVSLLGAHLL